MPTFLPASIEAYLREASFTSTEITILKSLLEQDGTIRELSSRLTKSNGCIDQALKKLLTKGIVQRYTINGHPRYSLVSPQSIVGWAEEDRRKKEAVRKRRHEDFASFIASLHIDNHRPDIAYFDTTDGLHKAYMQLLSTHMELLVYMPVTYKEEEDPLREMRVFWRKERYLRHIFQRTIAEDTSLGRRFQSRDCLEYRKTVLVPSSNLSLHFEKIIAGDVVACFDHAHFHACLIRYPALAQTERSLFSCLWSTSPSSAHSGTPQSSLGKTLFMHRITDAMRTAFSSIRRILISCTILLFIVGCSCALTSYAMMHHLV